MPNKLTWLTIWRLDNPPTEIVNTLPMDRMQEFIMGSVVSKHVSVNGVAALLFYNGIGAASMMGQNSRATEIVGKPGEKIYGRAVLVEEHHGENA